jgi:acyl carrier protein
MPTAIDAKLQDVFRAVFNLPATRDATTVTQASEKNWDSLAHAMLVAALESEFGIAIDTTDALDMTSYETTRQVLEEKLG